MALPIEDYALIGDRRTAALVGTNGSVDWLCLPNFDSAACLAGLLGTDDHGHWQLVPDGSYTTERRYVGASAVLETTFTTSDGVVTLTDLMPRNDGRADLIRKLKGVRGTVRMRHEWRVRLDYGLVRPWVRRATIDGEQVITADRRPGPAGAARAAAAEGGGRHPQRRVRRHRGRRAGLLDDLVPVVRRAHRPRGPARPDRGDHPGGRGVGEPLHHRHPAPRCGPPLAAHAPVDDRRGHRRDRGGSDHLAARGLRGRAQLGLPLLLAPRRRAHPRLPGPGRLHRGGRPLAGLAAAHYRRRPRARCRSCTPSTASRRLPEITLDHLPGYADSRPVRIGNGAVEQTQHDVLGEVMHALDRVRRAEGMPHKDAWPLQRALVAEHGRPAGRARTTGCGRSAASPRRSPTPG